MNNGYWIQKASLVLVGLLVLAGCSNTKRVVRDDPHYAPTVAGAHNIPHRTEGSLYQGAYGLNLFDDRKALRVGDIITITLNERTVSRKTAGVNTSKDSEINFNAGSVLGAPLTFRGNTMETDVQNSRNFSGNAGADQSNSLQGNITVTVAEVLPNGSLVVRGEKWMTLNRGDEFIRISGIVRPDDIAPDNTVPSTRLANAKISYSGTGSLADTQSMGWLSRFFNSEYWPF